jgi:hypothetical protein
VIGDADRRLPVGNGLADQLVEARRTVEHRELGVDMEMAERIGHGSVVAERGPGNDIRENDIRANGIRVNDNRGNDNGVIRRP